MHLLLHRWLYQALDSEKSAIVNVDVDSEVLVAATKHKE